MAKSEKTCDTCGNTLEFYSYLDNTYVCINCNKSYHEDYFKGKADALRSYKEEILGILLERDMASIMTLTNELLKEVGRGTPK